METLEINN